MSASRFIANPDLRNNGRKKLLFLGETGVGKSALCNVLSQPVQTNGTRARHDFPESDDTSIGNTGTILKNVQILAMSEREISLIDTVGFNSTEMENTAIAELIVSLKENCDFIHLFAIVVSAPRRVEASLKETIELFEGMFGKERFWQNAVLILTNLQQSDYQILRRSRTCSDEQLIERINETMRDMFSLGEQVSTLMIDAHYDGSRSDERDRFFSSVSNLYSRLMRSAGVSTDNIEKVVVNYRGLQDEVTRVRKERKEVRRYDFVNLRNNGRKKLLFLGVTGSGKSALCNALSQHVKTDSKSLNQIFPESKNQKIGNTETILKNINFLGRSSKEVSLIDTVGFNSTEINNTAIAELIVSLKDTCDFIHLFAIVVSAPKRIVASQKETIELFEGMFGKKKFWANAVLILTDLQQSDYQILRRSGTCSDEQLIEDVNKEMREMFGLERVIPTFIIDAHYDGSKQDERKRFSSSAVELRSLLMGSAGVSVDDVERVTGRYEGLQEKVDWERKEKEKARREAEDERFKKNIAIGCAAGAGGVVLAGAAVIAGPTSAAAAAAEAATGTGAAGKAGAAVLTAAGAILQGAVRVVLR